MLRSISTRVLKHVADACKRCKLDFIHSCCVNRNQDRVVLRAHADWTDWRSSMKRDQKMEPHASKSPSVDIDPGPFVKADIQETFKFTSYDCIGFDLDNTLARYKVGKMIDLVYDIMSRYLVEKKRYSKAYLCKPLDHSFIIKGLIVDDVHGNLLRIDPFGKVLQASHGTRLLNEEEILSYYPEQHWEVTDAFVSDPIAIWNSPHTAKMRTLLDYYDIAVSAVFARAVDSVDIQEGSRMPYKIWPDILESLVYMYQRENFKSNAGEYFPALKEHPEDFYYRCSDTLICWLKELRAQGKVLFLITGSHADFAAHTASCTLGPDWKSLFDIVVCFAKKPGFFTEKRPFLQLDIQKFTEVRQIPSKELKVGGIYSQGNWLELSSFLGSLSHKQNPAFLYVGDNLIQDIYTPNVYTNCDTVSVCEELEAEGHHGHQQWHPDEQFLVSSTWGSYFHCKTTDQITNWYYIMKLHSKLCIPSLEYVASLPIDHEYKVNTLY